MNLNLYKVFALLLGVLPAVCWSQTQKIQGGSTVYIDPMGGYESYLEAAFTKERVPLIVVDDKTKARYIITSTVAHQDFSSDGPAAMDNNRDAVAVNGNAAASIALFDPHISRILFAYAASGVGANQLEKHAEDCAKHLEKIIQKSPK